MGAKYFECVDCGYRTDDLDDDSMCPDCEEEMDAVEDMFNDEEEEDEDKSS